MTALETYITERYNKRSLKSILSQITQYKNKVGDRTEAANYQEILDYIGYLRERKLHAKSIINHLTSLKIYYRYLVFIEKREDHPCENIVLKDQLNKAIEIENLFSHKNLESLYESMTTNPINFTRKYDEKKSKALAMRDKLMIGLLIYQALTNTELIELRIEDIDLTTGLIKIREMQVPGRRSNKGREIALKSKQILILHQYVTEYRKELAGPIAGQNNDYLLLNENGQKQWQGYPYRMLQKATAGKYTPQKIRQSVIAHLLKENHDVRVVQEYAGHRNTGSTEAYKRTGLEELKASIERLHPRQ